jgi:hypothetical protein
MLNSPPATSEGTIGVVTNARFITVTIIRKTIEIDVRHLNVLKSLGIKLKLGRELCITGEIFQTFYTTESHVLPETSFVSGSTTEPEACPNANEVTGRIMLGIT